MYALCQEIEGRKAGKKKGRGGREGGKRGRVGRKEGRKSNTLIWLQSVIDKHLLVRILSFGHTVKPHDSLALGTSLTTNLNALPFLLSH